MCLTPVVLSSNLSLSYAIQECDAWLYSLWLYLLIAIRKERYLRGLYLFAVWQMLKYWHSFYLTVNGNASGNLAYPVWNTNDLARLHILCPKVLDRLMPFQSLPLFWLSCLPAFKFMLIKINSDAIENWVYIKQAECILKNNEKVNQQ